jgi:GNAT superfamily N-acetyltransferase
MKYSIVTLNEISLSQLKSFTDIHIGKNYYLEDELKTILKMSQDDMGCVSFALIDSSQNIFGIRLSLLPPYIHEVIADKYLTIDEWGVDLNKVAYFKSLFISPEFQGIGRGKELTNKSMEELKKRGTKAVLAHCWLESPNGSSKKYLEAMGFEAIKVHPYFWSEIDYLCSGCKIKPCKCTAIEMIYKF